MLINSLYRITSHKQVVDVDDASTSPNKVSNQVLIFENELPEQATLNKFIENSSVGLILIVDAFDKLPFNTFDSILGAEAKLKVIQHPLIEGYSGIMCLPDDYVTFYLGQELDHKPKVFNIKIITLSDRAHRGIYNDLSGPKAAELIANYFKLLEKSVDIKKIIIPDNADELHQIIEDALVEKTDVIITTGGTGIGPRDITVGTIKSHLEKEIPGIMEMIRMKYGAEKPNALLSGGVAGSINSTLVYTLPGNVKAVEEYLEEILKTLNHLLYMIHGIDNH